MTNDSIKEQALLIQATVRTQRHRLARLLANPWKTILPPLLKKTGGTRRRLARTFWGGSMEVILPEAVSTHIWRYGFFEADVCTYMLASLTPGMTFVDVGAHFGFFSLLASHLAGPSGRILSIEPMPATVEQLLRNVSSDPSTKNVTVHRCAAYSGRSELVFRDYGLVNAGLSSLYGARDSSVVRVSQEVRVEARRCDEMIEEAGFNRLDLIKIDAESSEMHVLQGLDGSLSKWKPRIILEVGDFDLAGVSSSAALLNWLSAHGYAPFEYAEGTLVPHQARARYGYGNLLFVPC